MLLPLFEFTRSNPLFLSVLLEYLSPGERKKTNDISPPCTILTLSSYLLTHASSTSSSRSIAYANLCLNCLLAFAETDAVLTSFCEPTEENIRLCRQRLPLLPVPQRGRPLTCALLDCCVLWLRHNLHKRLEVQSYTCVRCD